MQRVLFNLHLWTAMIAGVVLVMLGLTGAILAFEEPIDHMLNPGLFYVKPQGSPLPLASIYATLRQSFPKMRIGILMVGKAPDLAHAVPLKGFTAFVDPYTGRVLGTRKGSYFTQNVHQLHMRMFIGETGVKIVSVAALVLVFLTLSGIYLWWPLKRVTVAGRKSWRRFNFDLHHAAGFYSSVFLLILAITGAAIGFDDYAEPWMYTLTRSQPAEADTESTPVEGAKPISPDQAVATALKAVPGTTLVSLMLPVGSSGSYRVGLHFPEDRTPGGRSRVYVDQFSGEVLSSESSRTAPGGTRLLNLNRALHTGDIGGWPTKVIACLMSLAVVIQALTGVVMWWKRRGTVKRPAPVRTAEPIPANR